MKRMANEKQETKQTKEIKQTQTKEVKQKVIKEKRITVCGTVMALGSKGVAGRLELAKLVVANLKSKGITVNCHKYTIKEDSVAREIGAIIKDINDERNGWWSTYIVEESDTLLKFVLKPVKAKTN